MSDNDQKQDIAQEAKEVIEANVKVTEAAEKINNSPPKKQ